jgi:cell division protease FtsH
MDGKQPVRDIDNDNTPKSTGVPKAGKAHKKRSGDQDEPDAGLEPQPGT